MQSEVWQVIVARLRFRDMLNILQTCRELNCIFGEDLLWYINLKVTDLYVKECSLVSGIL